MWKIMMREIRSNDRATGIWALALGAVTYLMMYLFPSIAHQRAQWDKLIAQLPKGILAGFGMNQLQLSNIFGYYGTQIYPLLVLFAAIYAVMLFSQLLSREESEGTAEFLMAKPVSRSEIFLGKAVAGLVLAVAFNGVLFLITWAAFAQFHTAPYSVSTLAWFTAGMLLVTFVFGGCGLVVSAYITRPRTLMPVTLGIAIGTYLLGIASAMSPKLNDLRYLSPFPFVNAPSIVAHAAVPAADAVGLLVVFAALSCWAHGHFRMKDIVA